MISSTFRVWLVASPLLVGLWLRLDLRRHNYPYDYGANFSALWLIVMPYYLVKTRGKIGVLVFFGLILVIALPTLVADVVQL